MSAKLNEMRQKRAKHVADARALVAKAENEKRELTSEEQGQYDILWKEQETLESKIEREESLLRAEASLSEKGIAAHSGQEGGKQDSEEKKHRHQVFEKFLRHGRFELSREEIRALNVSTPSQGGYLQAPEQFYNQLIQGVDQVMKLRPRATIIKVNQGQSLGAPTLDTDMNDADWTSELTTANEDTALKFGKRQMKPSPLSKEVTISRALLNIPSFDIEGYVAKRMAYKFGVTEEKHGMTGVGSNQMLGIFTASDEGIPTSRDVSTDNTTTAVTFDGLIEAKAALDDQYYANAAWLAHNDFYKKVSKLKDSDGQYLWEPSRKVGEPDVLLGLPCVRSRYAPNTFTASKYVAALGDFSFYWIVESLVFEIQRLDELYAKSNRIGYIGRQEVDGAPVLAEAFVRVKLAAS